MKKHKKKKTASDAKQPISFKPLILSKGSVRQGKDVVNEYIQISEMIFDTLTGNESNVC